MELVFASSNQGKINELRQIIADLSDSISLLTIGDGVPEIPVKESGADFTENAILKAKAYARVTGKPTVADDSGLEVLALNGAPGVNSNRWYPGSDGDRNRALLDKLTDKSDRMAQFVTAVAYLPDSEAEPQIFIGSVSGKITDEPRGSAGFGYDPIFIPDGYAKTFAELGLAEKNKISHRAKAFKKFADYLANQYEKQ
jgi:XTP/dITP diphosphohydrolase